MNFVEIVELVDNIETKLSHLSESKLDLMAEILEEGTTDFDVAHHIDMLVEFVNAQTDENARIIAESVSGAEVLDIILEAVRKNSNIKHAIKEAQDNIEIKLLEQDETNTASVTLLSVVTNTLTEMLGEDAVESLPAEMIFDIAIEAKELELSDDAADMDLVELVEEISTKLKTAINVGDIDLDSDDYEGETLEEFLDDYEDIEDLLEEMAQVTEEILSESEDEVGVNLMRKAKEATTLIEAKMKRCPSGDRKCQMEKAKKAKKYYEKHEMPGGGNIKDIKLNDLHGNLRKHVKKAVKAARASSGGKQLSPDYIQYVLVPGIIKRMRIKNKKMKAKMMKTRPGMVA